MTFRREGLLRAVFGGQRETTGLPQERSSRQLQDEKLEPRGLLDGTGLL